MNRVLLTTQLGKYSVFMLNSLRDNITSLILADRAHDSIGNKEYGD